MPAVCPLKHLLAWRVLVDAQLELADDSPVFCLVDSVDEYSEMRVGAVNQRLRSRQSALGIIMTMPGPTCTGAPSRS